LRTADTTFANPRAFPVPLVLDSSGTDETASSDPAPRDPSTGTCGVDADTRTHRRGSTAPRTPAVPDAPPGYDLIERLGGGGMGEVYLARAHFADRLVAMKFLRSAGKPAALDRFTIELRALAALDHPNIIRVLADDFLRAEPYFTTEFAAGGTLGQWVEAHGPLDPRDAARLSATIARAIEAAHQRKILHRDIKPSNILLAVPGEVPAERPPVPRLLSAVVPKVSDFGLAKRMDEEGLTIGSSPLGTANYMPPEQVSKKNGEIGPASDVYGLGATMFHVLTGKAPFGSGDTAEVLYRVLTDPVPRPRAERPDVPPDLDGIVVKCLEKEPARRYQSAAALAEDLEAFLDGRAVSAPQQTPLRRARRWAVRNRVPLSVTVAFVIVLSVAGAMWEGQRDRNGQQVITQVDWFEETKKELAAGQRVTLIGEKELPRHHHWAFGPTALGLAPEADDACSFEAIQNSLLELHPNPGIDRYAVTADLRLLRLKGLSDAEATPPAMSQIGLYLNRVTFPGPDGRPVQTFLTVAFCDYLDNRAFKAGLKDAAVGIHAIGLIPRPGARVADPLLSFGRVTTFPSKQALPGEWRRVRFEVEPDGLRLLWASSPKDELKPFASLNAAVLNAMPLFRQMLDKNVPGLGALYPGWQPQSGIGVWSRGSALAVKNVTIEPLPQPR
jgi:serine/threonine protein kinase